MADPVKPDRNQPSWLSIATAIIVAVIGTLQTRDAVTPKPPTPVVVPPVVVEPPVVVPDVKPVPVPVVKPDLTPQPINTGVSVTDLRGNAIGNTVEPGHMFRVTAGSGVELFTQPELPTVDCDWVKTDGGIACTLRNAAVLTIVVTAPGQRPTIVSIKCNHAPNPPPVPVPNPVEPPAPDPAPISVGVRVLILKDALGKMSAEQVAAVGSQRVEDLLNAKCAKDAAGVPAWHRWDKDVDLSGLPQWKKLVDSVLSRVRSDGLDYPLLVVESGDKVHVYAITTEAAVLNTLNKAFVGA